LLVATLALLAIDGMAGSQVANLEALEERADHGQAWEMLDEADRLVADGRHMRHERDHLVERSWALQRESTLPRTLLAALTSPTVFARMRLAGVELTGRPEGDHVVLHLELPGGLEAAESSVRTWARNSLGMEVEAIESTEGEREILRVRVTGALPAPGAAR
jgi:hypothetical protein